jgi:hypothetical protein
MPGTRSTSCSAEAGDGAVTFAELHDRLGAAGVEVGIAVDDGGRLAVMLDSGERSIRYPAAGDLDRAAREIILSGRLREELGHIDAHGRDRHARGDWPEFIALWPLDERNT